jgi:hypothetical protein
VGVSGTAYGEFRTALRTRSYGLARNVARGLPHVSLTDALELTLLAADREPGDFEAMARRLLEWFLIEIKPRIDLVELAARDLHCLADGHALVADREQARIRLRETLGQRPSLQR